jgi:putative transposase
VFAGDEDYQYYLENIAECKQTYAIKVFAYCLMTNHVHLLLQPDEDEASISKFMKVVAARQTRYRNRLEGRTGTLWESRYKSSLVDRQSYLLACERYIELNPVRAKMVADPAHYRWSSYRRKMGLAQDHVVDLDSAYLELAGTDIERRACYRQFIEAGVSASEYQLIRESLQRGQLTGQQQFLDEIEAIIGRRVEQRGPGRPRKEVVT